MAAIMAAPLATKLLVAGTAMSAVGAIRQGNAAKAAGDYNAQIAENNAATAYSQGTVQQEAQRAKAREVIGLQLASVSNSGTALSGSNLDLLGESLYNQELDSLNIRYQSDLTAKGLQAQAVQDRYQGKQARTAGYLNAAASLMRAGSSYTNAGGKLN